MEVLAAMAANLTRIRSTIPQRCSAVHCGDVRLHGNGRDKLLLSGLACLKGPSAASQAASVHAVLGQRLHWTRDFPCEEVSCNPTGSAEMYF